MVKKDDLKKLIIENKKSTLKNHWKDTFFCNKIKYSGEIRPNEILLWRSSEYLRGNYPIFILNFDQNKNLIGIKTEKNPYHKFRNKQSTVIFSILILLLAYNTDLRETLIFTFAILIFGFLLHIVLSKARKYETKLLTNELRETIENIENIERINNPELIIESKKEEEEEWTSSKFITRLLLYPFCIFLLWFSLTILSPKEINFKIIAGIAIVLTYLITDILLIIRKKNNQHHH
ncbi:hypothetical protein EOD40_17645 [Flavobacterium sufflavum]|uniref:Uncharacterized protein n=1 Tax=Flavobacterium sufflavum TaxID=1921138 RepID=A0A437KJV8_9FLAO|nr:hypothetical protein [Flavobacterium sufflavum]RVT71092.1 hypothetical protein EOD40_17645 [Flavobacterium sufflavum]